MGEPVAVPVGVRLPEALLLSEMLPVFEGLAPAVSEPVGEAEVVELALTVVLAVPVGVWLLVAVLLSELLPVVEALAPSDSEPVGDADGVELALNAVLLVLDAVPVPLGVGEPVAVPVGV